MNLINSLPIAKRGLVHSFITATVLLVIIVGFTLGDSFFTFKNFTSPHHRNGTPYIVYEKQTVLKASNNDGKSGEVASEYYVANTDGSEPHLIHKITGVQYSTVALLNDNELSLITYPTDGMDIQNDITVLDMQGGIIKKAKSSFSSVSIMSDDAALVAHTKYIKNPKPGDGIPIEIFEKLLVENSSTGKILEEILPLRSTQTYPYLEPLAFSSNNEGLYYLEYPYRPQEVGTPSTLVYKSFTGEDKVLIENNFFQQPPYTAISTNQVFPEDNKALVTVLKVGESWNNTVQNFAILDLESKIYTPVAASCIFWTPQISSKDHMVHCPTPDHEITTFSTIDGKVLRTSKRLFDSDTADIDMISSDGQFAIYTEFIDFEKAKKNTLFLGNSILDAGVNLTVTHIVNVKRGSDKQLFVNLNRLYGPVVGDTTHHFLGFVDEDAVHS